MKKRTTHAAILPRLTNEQLLELLAAEERAKHDPDTNRPDCFTCHSAVTVWATGFGDDHEDERVVEVRPCGHRATYSAEVGEALAGHARMRAATEATELDRTRRYLRPVHATIISDDPDGVHLAVYEWLEVFGEWVTGPGLCGESMMQGPLPEGTEVTCSSCLAYQPKYERWLAPGYRPEDDDPDVLRKRAETAECEVAAARQFAEEMRTYCSPHGVAADYADRLLEHMDRAKEAGR